MSLPKYRLQPVLDARERKKKDAEKELAGTRAELAKQEKILAQREEDVQKAISKKEQYVADFMAKMDKGMETLKINQSKMYIEVLKQNIEAARKKVEEQKKVVHQCERKVQEAVKKVADATKEMKVIEKHKENWSEALKKEIQEKEEKEQEEVAQNLYEQFRRQK